MAANWFLSLLICLLISINLHLSFSQDGDSTSFIYSNSFALELISTKRNVTDLAKQYGFHLGSKHDYLNVYRLVHPDIPVSSKRKAHKFLERLKQDDRVKYILQLKQLLRHKKGSATSADQELSSMSNFSGYDVHHQQAQAMNWSRPIFTDPYFIDQWYLNNAGEIREDSPLNLNVIPLWEKNITGRGIRICVLDDGLDYTHPDIARNYDAEASTNLNGNFGDSDPMPDNTNPRNSHGTHCAGVVAAEANNSVCGVGVAYDAKIGGIRMLDGIITDLLEAEALLFKPNYIDIYSASWGPVDDGIRMEGPGKYTKLALQMGVQQGRNGLGSIYIWSTGNGGARYDDCNADGYVGSIETVAVGSISDNGLKPDFLEECPSMFVVTPTGNKPFKPFKKGNKERIQVVTTGLHGSCVENFGGTSAAAPLAAGCIALVLQANSLLTWRDIQHIVVHGARIPSINNTWFKNGAGIHFSNTFGFGMMDCSHMVKLAQSWNNVPIATSHSYFSEVMKRKISHAEPIFINISCNIEGGSLKINHLEHVQLYIKLKHSCRGELQICLISPSGTKSQMLSPRKLDCSKDGIDFYFLSVHHWEEDPKGNWTLQIFDTQNNENNGILIKWALILHGYMKERKLNTSSTKELAPEEVKIIIKKENLISMSLKLSSPKLEVKHNPRPIQKIDNLRRFVNDRFGSLLVPQLQRNLRNPYVSPKSNNLIKYPLKTNNIDSARKWYFRSKFTGSKLAGGSNAKIKKNSLHHRPAHLRSFDNMTKIYPSCNVKLHSLGRNKECIHINKNISNKLSKLLIILTDSKIHSKAKLSHLTNNNRSNISVKNLEKFTNSSRKNHTSLNYSVKYKLTGRFIAERMFHPAAVQSKPNAIVIQSESTEQNLLGNIIKKLEQLIPTEDDKHLFVSKSSTLGKNLKVLTVEDTKVPYSNTKVKKNDLMNEFPIKKEPVFEGELKILQIKQNDTLEL
ncbi:PC3-like endoprotease variant B [Octopus sinensis]|uniref:PC3-like endoprotease variant B n=1 Tax=Octopus sinensis TaxID=2607531 RepID=A0A7E6FI16_9MOLL|nr:PC3-like endoprotease variant B [Octopus sinensis]